MATTQLEPAPIYTSVVTEQPDGRFQFTPQWLQWFLNIRAQVTTTINTTSVHLFKALASPLTLTTSFQTVASVSFTAINPPPAYLLLVGLAQLAPAAGSPITFEDCVFELLHGTSVLQTITVSSYGNENTAVSLQALDMTNFHVGTVYTLTLKAKCLGTPSAIFPVVQAGTLSAVGTSS